MTNSSPSDNHATTPISKTVRNRLVRSQKAAVLSRAANVPNPSIPLSKIDIASLRPIAIKVEPESYPCLTTPGDSAGGDATYVEHRHTPPAPEEHIPRPRNAFLVFRSYHRLKFGTGKRECDISKSLSATWKTLSPQERGYYQQLAEEEKQEHKRKYPNYKYSPKRNTTSHRFLAKMKVPARKQLDDDGYDSDLYILASSKKGRRSVRGTRRGCGKGESSLLSKAGITAEVSPRPRVGSKEPQSLTPSPLYRFTPSFMSDDSESSVSTSPATPVQRSAIDITGMSFPELYHPSFLSRLTSAQPDDLSYLGAPEFSSGSQYHVAQGMDSYQYGISETHSLEDFRDLKSVASIDNDLPGWRWTDMDEAYDPTRVVKWDEIFHPL